MSEDTPIPAPQGNQKSQLPELEMQPIIKAPRPAARPSTTKRPVRQPPRSTPNKSSAAARPKLKQSPPQQSQARKRPVVPNNKVKKPRLIFWAKVILITFLIASIAITIRAMVNIDSHMKGITWSEELKHGHIERAAQKFFTLSSDAIDQVFASDLSPEALMSSFNDALPHLKKAGYVLTELEIEVGISPKLIPHFYHDPAVELDLEQALEALKDNTVGTALMISLAQASNLQKTVEISHMQFNHIEVELGPIPALKLQYKNDNAIKEYIHHKD